MKRARMLTVLLFAVAVSAHAVPLGDNTVRLAPSQLKLPQAIGPLRFHNQSRFSDRRLGRSFGYNASGISLSIYVYDHGVKDIPDGANTVPLCQQFESAKREIERGGNYENVKLRWEASRPLVDTVDSPVAREAVYELDRRGIRALSALWLTAVDGYFLKLRLSLRWEVSDELDDAREHILAAIAHAIATRRPRPARAEAPSLPEATIEVASHYDVTTAALWYTYAARLVAHSREHPERRPPCGGWLEPGFAGELAARRAALAEFRARAGEAGGGGYFGELARIDDAGFLAEYVWTFLRDERLDVSPPVELRLDDFESFRERELPAHEIETGARVRINTVRELPIAPPVR